MNDPSRGSRDVASVDPARGPHRDFPLFVSDLDFTLLRSDATLSARTIEVVNRVITAGHLVTCATARSFRSTARVTRGLQLTLPLLTYGGSVRVEPLSGAITSVEPLPVEAVAAVISATDEHPGIEPLLFAMIDGRDRVCWRDAHATGFVESFVARRANDPRLLAVPDWGSLAGAPVFYATVIGERDDIDGIRRELLPHLTGCFDTVGPDAYNPGQTWFEIMSTRGTKAAAARALADELGADRLIAFGDNLNDVPLFRIADHGCAVANAVPELLAVADEVIPANDDDGVAHWLERHVLAAERPVRDSTGD